MNINNHSKQNNGYKKNSVARSDVNLKAQRESILLNIVYDKKCNSDIYLIVSIKSRKLGLTLGWSG